MYCCDEIACFIGNNCLVDISCVCVCVLKIYLFGNYPDRSRCVGGDTSNDAVTLTYRLEEGAGLLTHSHRRSVVVLVWASKLALGPISRQNLSEKWLLPNY